MALGARTGDVLGMIVFESGRPVILGLIVGSVAGAGASRLIVSLLFGLNPLDPIMFLSVGLLFFAIALIAAYLPARRAAHIRWWPYAASDSLAFGVFKLNKERFAEGGVIRRRSIQRSR